MKILLTNTGPWGTGSATAVDAVSLEMIEQCRPERWGE